MFDLKKLFDPFAKPTVKSTPQPASTSQAIKKPVDNRPFPMRVPGTTPTPQQQVQFTPPVQQFKPAIVPQFNRPQVKSVIAKPNNNGNPFNMIGDAGKFIGDFVPNAIGSGLKSGVAGISNAVNDLTTGFDKYQTQKNTQDLLNTLGLSKLGNGKSVGAKAGQAVGDIISGLATFVPTTGEKVISQIPKAVLQGELARAANDAYAKGNTALGGNLQAESQNHGITLNDVASNTAQGVLAALTSGAGVAKPVTNAAENALAKGTGNVLDRAVANYAKFGEGAGLNNLAKNLLVKQGGTGAAFGLSGTVADPNATPQDYLNSAASGYAGGVGFGLLGKALSPPAKAVNKVTTKLVSNTPKGRVGERGSIQLPTINQELRQMNETLRSLNTEHGKLLAKGLSENSPAVKANARSYKIALNEKMAIQKRIGQRGSAEAGMFDPTGKLGKEVPKTSYRSSHQIDTVTSRNLSNLTNLDGDINTIKSKYGLTNYDNKDITNLKKIVGNPEADVKIYRSSPVNEINNGDWVTTSKTYANDIKAQNGGKVYEYTVKAKDLNLPQNIEDNPSLARFSAFQYNKSDIAPQVSKTAELPIVGPKITKTTSKKASEVDPLLKERGFVKSAKQSEFVSDAAKSQLDSTYTTKANKVLQDKAAIRISKDPTKAYDYALRTHSDEGTATAIALAQEYRKTGKYDLEASLINEKARRLTEAGREVQAASLIDKMSPEGVVQSAAQTIQKYNETAKKPIPELTGKIAEQFTKQAEKIGKMKDGRAKNVELWKLKEDMANLIPSTVADKAITVWKAGLLTSLRTHERNLFGNSIMLGSEVAKDVPSVLADKLMSLKTGKRTLTPTVKGMGEFGSKGTRQQVSDLVKYGVDLSKDISKYDVNHITWGKGKIQQGLKAYTDAVFRPLGAEDVTFANAAMARSLYDQAGAMAINAGKKGDAGFIRKLVKKPTDTMLETALKDAEYATFHDKTALGGLASKGKQFVQGLPGWKGEVGKVASEVIAPFTGVPTSIAGKTVAYSPIGLAKGIVNTGRVLAGKVPELQRQAAQEIGRGVMGTGLFGLGAYLTSQGLMTGQPKDAKEAELWAAENKPSNSVKMPDGKWYGINSIGPQSLVMLAGSKAQEEMAKGDKGNLGTYAAGVGKDQLSQTFLAGVQGPLNALTDPVRYGQSYLGSQASSVVPNIIKDTAKAFDTKQRENNSVGDYFQNSIPGWRNMNVVKRDVMGKEMPQEPTGPSAFVDLFNSKTPNNDPVIQELDRLYNVGQEATPSKLNKNMSVLGQKFTLTPTELNNFEKTTGESVSNQFSSIMNTPEYQQASDEAKKKVLDSLVSDIRSSAKMDVASGVTPTSTVSTTSKIDTSKLDNPAKVKLTLDQFDKSGKNYLEKDGYVYTRDAQGKAGYTTKIKYDYSLNKEVMTQQKNNDDLAGWMQTAQAQVASIDKQLQDKNLDPKEKVSLENDRQAILDSAAKYQGYGGFTKGSSSKGKKIDYASQISASNEDYMKYDTALRNLVKKSKIKRKKAKA